MQVSVLVLFKMMKEFKLEACESLTREIQKSQPYGRQARRALKDSTQIGTIIGPSHELVFAFVFNLIPCPSR